MNTPNAPKRAMEVARDVHRNAGARQTFLFGSRARGDYRNDSDIDLLIIIGQTPADSWLEDIRRKARQTQRNLMPEASGIDIICLSEADFLSRSHLRNNMANTIIKEGQPVMSGEHLGYRLDHGDEEVDWTDVDQKMNDAVGAANWIEAIRQAGIMDAGDDKQFGRVAQNALEFAYKAVIAAHGHEYPTSGRDGHNLTILTQLLRDREIVGQGKEVPGENHRYLTEFGVAAVYAHEHPPLNRGLIAEDIPDAVSRLRTMVLRTMK